MADSADLASAMEEAERQWALRSRRRERICTVCGEVIAPARLDLLPDTDVCTGCAQAAAEGG